MTAVIEPRTDSALALTTLSPGGDAVSLTDPEVDSLLFVSSGSGSLTVAGSSVDLDAGMAALVLAGEEAEIRGELELVRVTAGRVPDLHAPLGGRELVVRVDPGRTRQALDARGYQVLFGPHNGSVRATLFVGFLPPGRSPWHYHLYDEIVWIPEGPGVLHRAELGSQDPLEAGSAFRLRPREVHIVENSSADSEMTLLGAFTPAGSPSAAYLADG